MSSSRDATKTISDWLRLSGHKWLQRSRWHSVGPGRIGWLHPRLGISGLAQIAYPFALQSERGGEPNSGESSGRSPRGKELLGRPQPTPTARGQRQGELAPHFDQLEGLVLCRLGAPF